MVRTSEIMEECQALPGHLPALIPVSPQTQPNSLKQVSRSLQGQREPAGTWNNFPGASSERQPLGVTCYMGRGP